MFRYRADRFAGLSRAKFLAALARAGVHASAGYTPLNTSAHVLSLAKSRHYLKIYGESAMRQWAERNRCPVNDQLCTEGAWFQQTVLLNPRSEMERIADAIRKVQRNAAQLAKA
jgi:hypothetical protein